MSDRAMVGVAMAVCVAARVGWHVPVWLVIATCGAASVARRVELLVVAVVLLSSLMSSRAMSGLDVMVGEQLSGVATLVSDPVRKPGGYSMQVSVASKRYSAFVSDSPSSSSRANATMVDFGTALVGERFELVATTKELRANEGWRRSEHLAGSLRITEVGGSLPAEIWWRAANGLRRTIEAGLDSFDTEEAALFTGVVYGDDRNQGDLTKHQFRVSGLSHLLAVSGQNVAFLLVVAAPFLLRLSLRGRWVATVLILAGFLLVTRFEPSVLRAVVMAGVAASAAWKGRQVSGLRVVAVAVAGLILIDPLLVYSVGFQLSVGATVALVVLSAPLVDVLWGPRWLTVPLGVSLAAQAGTAPLLVAYFGKVPLLGPLTNVVGGLLGGWLMMWGAVSAPVAGLRGGASGWLNLPSLWVVRGLGWVARLAATPGVPMVGWTGALTMLLGPSLVWWSTRKAPQVGTVNERWLRFAPRAVGVLAAVGLAVSSLSGARGQRDEQGRETVASGLRLVRATDVAVLVVDHPARSSGAFRLVESAGVSRLDALVVVGGGRNSKTLAWDLRRGLDIGTIVAEPELQVPGALPLAGNTIRVGSLDVDV